MFMVLRHLERDSTHQSLEFGSLPQSRGKGSRRLSPKGLRHIARRNHAKGNLHHRLEKDTLRRRRSIKLQLVRVLAGDNYTLETRRRQPVTLRVVIDIFFPTQLSYIFPYPILQRSTDVCDDVFERALILISQAPHFMNP
ncbi:uncharacterized protein LOC114352177 [Ostrinia furnacalis]|uniref:uncharacterized protein LOC114352177 n=1 Tax=Ostrinia furnacalis TaxID=93504 RepID=UPI00103DC2CA|nr:uncharacterized protein LOC114352177 [Ostrinia furnacalis]XP_028159478.1 uncharacterized protein LOC114352177 [Ostrinia furnacalis]